MSRWRYRWAALPAIVVAFVAAGLWDAHRSHDRAAAVLEAGWSSVGRSIVGPRLTGIAIVGGSFVEPNGAIQPSPEDLRCFRYDPAARFPGRTDLCFTTGGRLVELLRETPRGGSIAGVLPNQGWAPVDVGAAKLARASGVAVRIGYLLYVLDQVPATYAPCSAAVDRLTAVPSRKTAAASVVVSCGLVAKGLAAVVPTLGGGFAHLGVLVRRVAATAARQASLTGPLAVRRRHRRHRRGVDVSAVVARVAQLRTRALADVAAFVREGRSLRIELSRR